MDTEGQQLIPWEELTPEDVVIIPAFGTTVEIADKLRTLGIEPTAYNTTCPFVEKVWKRSAKLGEDDFTVIIHGKHRHEETRATFSHSYQNAPSLIIKDMEEAHFLGDVIIGKRTVDEFEQRFNGRSSKGFDPSIHLDRIGVVNQTTMLAH
jgi:4-hydroxy-3-methylbut-2-enyl diphosphate reductase